MSDSPRVECAWTGRDRTAYDTHNFEAFASSIVNDRFGASRKTALGRPATAG